MDGIRHYIFPTSVLPWRFQVSVVPSIFPFVFRAAMYGGGGYSLHKDTEEQKDYACDRAVGAAHTTP